MELQTVSYSLKQVACVLFKTSKTLRAPPIFLLFPGALCRRVRGARYAPPHATGLRGGLPRGLDRGRSVPLLGEEAQVALLAVMRDLRPPLALWPVPRDAKEGTS